MHQGLTRRGFLEISSAAAAAAALGQQAGAWPQQAASQSTTTAPALQYERPPALKPEDAQAFVGIAHRDVDKVREMLDEEPTLVNAAWDWGGGDWETAMGAAGHTGHDDIAMLLLERGARIELHAAAMLGWLDVVKAAIAARPGAENIPGPHAIPMWSHARYGDERAAGVLAYLESLGAVRDEPVEEDARLTYAGTYRVAGSDDMLMVINANRRLLLQPPDRRPWYMLHQGNGVFVPADEPDAKVTFESKGGAVVAMHMERGGGRLTAARME